MFHDSIRMAFFQRHSIATENTPGVPRGWWWREGMSKKRKPEGILVRWGVEVFYVLMEDIVKESTHVLEFTEIVQHKENGASRPASAL